MTLDFSLINQYRELFAKLGVSSASPYERRIFTNRNLNFKKISVVGFDLDYTLASYRQEQLEALTFQCASPKLLQRGFPEAALERLFDARFAIRGLMIDKEYGNVLKMDRHGYVGRAYHGKSELDDPERQRLYREQRLGTEHERFAPVDTLFSLPEVTLFASAVEHFHSRPEAWQGERSWSFRDLWQAIRECVDESHRDDTIKSRIRQRPDEYLNLDPELGATLHKLRSSGKKLFLLTNGEFSHADILLKFLLKAESSRYGDWRNYFDWIVLQARKPGFFTDSRPFKELDDAGKWTGKTTDQPAPGRIYAEGNQTGLQKSLQAYADEVLYVGDHIYDDIVKSKKSSGWRTALIVQELEHDLAVRNTWSFTLREIEALHPLRAKLAEEISILHHVNKALDEPKSLNFVKATAGLNANGKALSRMRDNLRAIYLRYRQQRQQIESTLDARSLELSEAFNPYWGSVFSERFDTSRFGAQLESFACLYTSRVSNFLFVSPEEFFHAPHGSLPHWM